MKGCYGRTIKNQMLSYQHHISFFEDDLAGIIYSLCHVNKIGCGLWLAADSSIPAFAYFTGTENKLSPAIIDSEIIQLFDANTNRAENIIATISVGGKCARNKNISARFKKFHSDRILPKATE